jgi:hypothetical protein
MPVISALWRLKQQDGEFKASMGYVARLSQKISQPNKKI